MLTVSASAASLAAAFFLLCKLQDQAAAFEQTEPAPQQRQHTTIYSRGVIFGW